VKFTNSKLTEKRFSAKTSIEKYQVEVKVPLPPSNAHVENHKTVGLYQSRYYLLPGRKEKSKPVSFTAHQQFFGNM